MTEPLGLSASCHCGAVQETLSLRSAKALSTGSSVKDNLPQKISLCHCRSCRHTTGLLCTSYFPIAAPRPEALYHANTYHSADLQSNRYFCSICGCHVFRSHLRHDKQEDDWEVATGVMSDVSGYVHIGSHLHVSETRDGGVASWIEVQDGDPVTVYQGCGPESEIGDVSSDALAGDLKRSISIASFAPEDTLQASCHCGTVRFHVTRPDASSKFPRSNFPDLMIPYLSEDPVLKNPEDVKWWLKANDTKYLAGTCACRSCRLISGFEIQTWAFIPRSNIYFHVKDPAGKEVIPLDFKTLQKGILKSYNSSPGVLREFCGTCGATVFWHDEHRPDLIDVSIGLLDADEGSRAENWLEWWTERVSFEEEPEKDRPTREGQKKFDLIPELHRGLQAWGRASV